MFLLDIKDQNFLNSEIKTASKKSGKTEEYTVIWFRSFLVKGVF